MILQENSPKMSKMDAPEEKRSECNHVRAVEKVRLVLAAWRKYQRRCTKKKYSGNSQQALKYFYSNIQENVLHSTLNFTKDKKSLNTLKQYPDDAGRQVVNLEEENSHRHNINLNADLDARRPLTSEHVNLATNPFDSSGGNSDLINASDNALTDPSNDDSVTDQKETRNPIEDGETNGNDCRMFIEVEASASLTHNTTDTFATGSSDHNRAIKRMKASYSPTISNVTNLKDYDGITILPSNESSFQVQLLTDEQPIRPSTSGDVCTLPKNMYLKSKNAKRKKTVKKTFIRNLVDKKEPYNNYVTVQTMEVPMKMKRRYAERGFAEGCTFRTSKMKRRYKSAKDRVNNFEIALANNLQSTSNGDNIRKPEHSCSNSVSLHSNSIRSVQKECSVAKENLAEIRDPHNNGTVVGTTKIAGRMKTSHTQKDSEEGDTFRANKKDGISDNTNGTVNNKYLMSSNKNIRRPNMTEELKSLPNSGKCCSSLVSSCSGNSRSMVHEECFTREGSGVNENARTSWISICKSAFSVFVINNNVVHSTATSIIYDPQYIESNLQTMIADSTSLQNDTIVREDSDLARIVDNQVSSSTNTTVDIATNGHTEEDQVHQENGDFEDFGPLPRNLPIHDNYYLSSNKKIIPDTAKVFESSSEIREKNVPKVDLGIATPSSEKLVATQNRISEKMNDFEILPKSLPIYENSSVSSDKKNKCSSSAVLKSSSKIREENVSQVETKIAASSSKKMVAARNQISEKMNDFEILPGSLPIYENSASCDKKNRRSSSAVLKSSSKVREKNVSQVDSEITASNSKKLVAARNQISEKMNDFEILSKSLPICDNSSVSSNKKNKRNSSEVLKSSSKIRKKNVSQGDSEKAVSSLENLVAARNQFSEKMDNFEILPKSLLIYENSSVSPDEKNERSSAVLKLSSKVREDNVSQLNSEVSTHRSNKLSSRSENSKKIDRPKTSKESVNSPKKTGRIVEQKLKKIRKKQIRRNILLPTDAVKPKLYDGGTHSSRSREKTKPKEGKKKSRSKKRIDDKRPKLKLPKIGLSKLSTSRKQPRAKKSSVSNLIKTSNFSIPKSIEVLNSSKSDIYGGYGSLAVLPEDRKKESPLAEKKPIKFYPKKSEHSKSLKTRAAEVTFEAHSDHSGNKIQRNSEPIEIIHRRTSNEAHYPPMVSSTIKSPECSSRRQLKTKKNHTLKTEKLIKPSNYSIPINVEIISSTSNLGKRKLVQTLIPRYYQSLRKGSKAPEIQGTAIPPEIPTKGKATKKTLGRFQELEISVKKYPRVESTSSCQTRNDTSQVNVSYNQRDNHLVENIWIDEQNELKQAKKSSKTEELKNIPEVASKIVQAGVNAVCANTGANTAKFTEISNHGVLRAFTTGGECVSKTVIIPSSPSLFSDNDSRDSFLAITLDDNYQSIEQEAIHNVSKNINCWSDSSFGI